MEERAVVGCDCNWGFFVEVVRDTGDCGEDGLGGDSSAIGRGGRGGRCSFSLLSCTDVSLLAPLVALVLVEVSEVPSSPAIVIEEMMPWSAVAIADGYIELSKEPDHETMVTWKMRSCAWLVVMKFVITTHAVVIF